MFPDLAFGWNHSFFDFGLPVSTSGLRTPALHFGIRIPLNLNPINPNTFGTRGLSRLQDSGLPALGSQMRHAFPPIAMQTTSSWLKPGLEVYSTKLLIQGATLAESSDPCRTWNPGPPPWLNRCLPKQKDKVKLSPLLDPRLQCRFLGCLIF